MPLYMTIRQKHWLADKQNSQQCKGHAENDIAVDAGSGPALRKM